MVSYTWVEPFPDWEIDNSWGTLSTHSKNRFLMFNIAACVRLTTKTPRTKTISTLKLTSLLYYNKSQTKWTYFSECTKWQTNFTIQRCTLTRTGMLIPLVCLLINYILLSCFRLQSSFRVHKTTLMRQCLLALVWVPFTPSNHQCDNPTIAAGAANHVPHIPERNIVNNGSYVCT